MEGQGGGEAKLPFPERLADWRRPVKKTESDGVNWQTDRQTDEHRNLETESKIYNNPTLQP